MNNYNRFLTLVLTIARNTWRKQKTRLKISVLSLFEAAHIAQYRYFAGQNNRIYLLVVGRIAVFFYTDVGQILWLVYAFVGQFLWFVYAFVGHFLQKEQGSPSYDGEPCSNYLSLWHLRMYNFEVLYWKSSRQTPKNLVE